MANLLLLVLCFALGAAARRGSGLPPDSHRVLNLWLLHVSLPALVLRSVHGAVLRPAMLLGAASLWLVFLLAAGAALLARRQKWTTTREAGGLALAVGLGNTAFVGLPLLETLGGPEALAVAVVIDQLGSFVALAFLAIPFASALAGNAPSPLAHAGRILRFPPMIALVAALLLRGVPFPAALDAVLGRLADMLSPLALASIGWLLDPAALRGRLRRVAVGLLPGCSPSASPSAWPRSPPGGSPSGGDRGAWTPGFNPASRPRSPPPVHRTWRPARPHPRSC
jgi:predicted permease